MSIGIRDRGMFRVRAIVKIKSADVGVWVSASLSQPLTSASASNPLLTFVARKTILPQIVVALTSSMARHTTQLILGVLARASSVIRLEASIVKRARWYFGRKKGRLSSDTPHEI